ncbi:MAG: tagatose 1,6-diphosphate aldolase [Chloroflexota bacterium]
MRTETKTSNIQRCANDQGQFAILALDHGLSLQQTIRPQAPETVTPAEMINLKRDLLLRLSIHASGVLLDPIYGLDGWQVTRETITPTGLLLAIEDGDYASTTEAARYFPDWTVSKLKAAGADAIKCFFYYHPEDTALTAKQETFVSQLVEECQAHDLPLFAEPLSYSTTPETRPAVVVETARRISRLGIDILKVEFPIDAQVQADETLWRSACDALNTASVVPWALLSAGVNFETFTKQVEIACRAGASGYLVGRAVWKDAVTLNGQPFIDKLENEVIPRLNQLSDIVKATAQPFDRR